MIFGLLHLIQVDLKILYTEIPKLYEKDMYRKSKNNTARLSFFFFFQGVFDLLIRMLPSDPGQTVPFGRYELFFAQICEYTKYHENRVVGAPGHGQSNTTIFGRPDASMSVSVVGIMFRTR